MMLQRIVGLSACKTETGKESRFWLLHQMPESVMRMPFNSTHGI
jgi:hypothetical protein